MLRRVSALTVDHLKLAIFLACATYASTYMVGIRRIIKIIVININLLKPSGFFTYRKV